MLYDRIELDLEGNYTSGTNIVINTNQADLSLITISKFNLTDNKNDFDMIYFIPYSVWKADSSDRFMQPISQIIDLHNMGMLTKGYVILKVVIINLYFYQIY